MGQDAAEREIEEAFDDADEVKKNNEHYFHCLEQFYTEVAEKMILFDPLDRAIPSDEDDQTTKQQQLLFEIKQMEGIKGDNLENPLNYEQNARFQQLQMIAKNQIIDLANRQLQIAKDAGAAYGEDFRDDPLFIKTFFAFRFFAQHQLVGNAQEVLDDFMQYVEKQSQFIDKAKTYQKMDAIGREIYDVEE